MTSENRKPRIAVDAMGGDLGAESVIPGVVQAVRDGLDVQVVLYGDPEILRKGIETAGASDLGIEIEVCTQNIAMDESPASAVRGKPDSPIIKAMKHQREGKVDAVVSAGSTGAMVAASLLILGRLKSAARPAIATFIPTVKGESLLVDAGANTQCTPEMLYSFAVMGDAYCRTMQSLDEPTIGLMNIGGEKSKGNDLTVAAYAQMSESSLNFTGNVEGNEVLVGACDVLVADGFTGNIVLKMCEGLASFFKALGGSGQLENEELGALKVLAGVIGRRFNYEVYGGAPLLGVDGVSIICHGRSTPLAITYAVKAAARQVEVGLPSLIEQALASIASEEG